MKKKIYLLLFFLITPFCEINIKADQFSNKVDPETHYRCLDSKNYWVCRLGAGSKKFIKGNKPWLKADNWKTYDMGCFDDGNKQCYLSQYDKLTQKDNLIHFKERYFHTNSVSLPISVNRTINCNHSSYKYLIRTSFNNLDEVYDHSEEHLKVGPHYDYFCLKNKKNHANESQLILEKFYQKNIADIYKDIYKFTKDEVLKNKNDFKESIKLFGIEKTINHYTERLLNSSPLYTFLILKFNHERLDSFFPDQKGNKIIEKNDINAKLKKYKRLALKGYEKIALKINNEEKNCNEDLCYPSEITNQERDNLDEKIIKGWALSDDPLNKRSYYYDMKVYKVKSKNGYGRYLNTRSIYKFLWRGRPGTPGSFTSRSGGETTCYGSGPTFNCYTPPTIINFTPGTPPTQDKVHQVRRDIVYDCKDKTMAKYQRNSIKRIKDINGKKRKWLNWSALEGSPEKNNTAFWAINTTNIEKWCEILDQLPESDFEKFSKSK